MSDLFWLTDAQIARPEPFSPKSHGKPRVDDRRVLSGIVLINRQGLRWGDGPPVYMGRYSATVQSVADGTLLDAKVFAHSEIEEVRLNGDHVDFVLTNGTVISEDAVRSIR